MSSNSSSTSQLKENTIPLANLPIDVLSQIKTKQDGELQHLTSSLSALRSAQVKFRQCITCIRDGLYPTPSNTATKPCPNDPNSVPDNSTETSRKPDQENPDSDSHLTNTSNISKPLRNVMVPLTSSLYVPGVMKFSSPVDSFDPTKEFVMVDIGTGYLVEKSLPAAIKYYEERVSGLATDISKVEVVLRKKVQESQAVDEFLKQKIMSTSKRSTN